MWKLKAGANHVSCFDTTRKLKACGAATRYHFVKVWSRPGNIAPIWCPYTDLEKEETVRKQRWAIESV